MWRKIKESYCRSCQKESERLTVNEIQITGIEKCQNKIIYHYIISGEWKKYFRLEQEFFVSYEEDITLVPDSMLVIPFMVNILPIAWVCNANISIDSIDESFYKNIEKIKEGYINMYPHVNFGGMINVNDVVDNSYVSNGDTATLFSGGVDAFSTLITHIKEKPILITLWGADVKLDDFDGWKRVKEHAMETGLNFNCINLFVKSSFRLFINEDTLSDLVIDYAGDNWWHGFQHGIGLIGHVAPLAYLHKIKTLYIASSFTIREKGKVTCASDPTIDNYVHMGSCITVHDGYELTRQKKLERICDYKRKSGKKISLRVCWMSRGGSNCCSCEKCYRTIAGIVAEGENPIEYGFDIEKKIFGDIKKSIKYKIVFDDVTRTYWHEIQQRFVDNPYRLSAAMRWIVDEDFETKDKKRVGIYKRIYLIGRKIYIGSL